MSSRKSETVFPLKKILVAADGSENANRAVTIAAKLAKQNNSELVIVHVVAEIIPAVYSPIGTSPSPDYTKIFEIAEAEGTKIVEKAVALAKSEGANVRGKSLRTVSSVVETITNEAQSEKADLLVVGTRGLGGFKRLIMGSVSSGVVSHADCAVLIVR